MTARVLTITERHLRTPGHPASLADFTYVEGDEIDPRVVIDSPDVSLYGFDDASRHAVFAQLPPGVDLTKVPFVYLAQGEQAERLIVVPYDAFMQLAAELPEIENFIPVYNTGRCGSTLLSHVFNELNTVVSLSEPDAPAQFALLRDRREHRDPELSGLLDSAMRFLFKPHPHKLASTYALKFRSEAVRVMDLYGATFPGAKNLFLYRDAVGWVTSWYRVFRNTGMPEHIPLGEWPVDFKRFYRKDADYLRTYLGGGDGDIPLVKLLAFWWLLPMEAYLAQHERGVRALAVRYDDLNTRREVVLHEIFAYCGLPLSDITRALRASERDSQAGTWLARSNATRANTLRLSAEQIADIHDVLQRHPVINTPGFVLPGTLEV